MQKRVLCTIHIWQRMFEILLRNIQNKISLTEAEKEICTSFFTAKKLRKKQYFLQEGDVCKYLAFVEKGALRSYTIDEKGAEHILQFALENWWISDMYSFYTQLPGTYTIDALEDSEILLITLADFEKMLLEVPKMERYIRILLQNNLIASNNRMSCSLTFTAEQKYYKFTESFPDIFNRVPQHMIASFLGFTKETLSRIRSKKV